jgi:predicted DNA-binding antitoxin AbrB/MazE fold protein
MQPQNCQAIFENGFLRPLAPLQLNEGESVTLIIKSSSRSQTKQFPETGLIAQLTANPIKIEDFQPLTREEANERG